MLLYLFDRVATQTAVFGLATWGTWQLRDLAHLSLVYGIIAVLSVWYIHLLVTAISRERRLASLGARGPSVRTWTPLNLGFIYNAVWHMVRHRNHEFWWSIFDNVQAAGQSLWTVEAMLMGERIVFTADDENIKAILATQFGSYGKGPQFRKEWKDFLGLSMSACGRFSVFFLPLLTFYQGIFTTDGDMWHNSRQLIRPQFIKDRVSDLNTFETHFQALLPLLQGSLPGSTVRVDDLFFRFTLDAATDFLLGNSVNSLENPRVEFADAFAEVQHVQALIARAGPAQGLISKKGFYKSLKVLNAFVEKYVDQALALSPAELEAKTKSDHGYTFLHSLASYTRDRTVLRDQLVAVLLAGRDTTAVTLSWLFYSLSQHPEVVTALRQEIFATLGPDPTTKPTYEHLKSMRYLQHTMNETLRLYPVVPYNVRVALKDTTLPRGGGPDGSQPLAVLKDTPIGYSTLILQHRNDLYPTTYPSDAEKAFPDPQKFDPSRWDS